MSPLEQITRRFGRPPSIIVIGAGGGERAERFTAAATAAGFASPRLFSWVDVLRAPERIEAALVAASPTFLRLEAHDGNFDSWLALAEAGACAIAASGGEPLTSSRLEPLRDEPGLIWRHDLRLMHRQAYLGLNDLAMRAAQAAQRTGATLLNDPEAIAICGDKNRCHSAMRGMGLSVPDTFDVEECTFEALLAAMEREKRLRVFVKPRYGSSAAGIVALAVSAYGVTAWSPAQVVDSGSARAIYACKRVRKFNRPGEVAALTEAVLSSGAQIEAWIPKAGHDGSTVDLRLLTIAGEPQHLVLRQAGSPITNLHLGARRGEAASFLGRLHEGVWETVCEEAGLFAQRFPRTLQLSFDIAVPVALNRHYFLEANAFGDLLRRTTHNGLDPYAAQFAALPQWILPHWILPQWIDGWSANGM